jgi:hypothetical protein
VVRRRDARWPTRFSCRHNLSGSRTCGHGARTATTVKAKSSAPASTCCTGLRGAVSGRKFARRGGRKGSSRRRARRDAVVAVPSAQTADALSTGVGGPRPCPSTCKNRRVTSSAARWRARCRSARRRAASGRLNRPAWTGRPRTGMGRESSSGADRRALSAPGGWTEVRRPGRRFPFTRSALANHTPTHGGRATWS